MATITVDGKNQKYDSRDNCNAIIETSTNTLVSGCKTTDIPNTVTIIGENAFMDCKDLTAITIPESVTMIGNYAFFRCSELASVTLKSFPTFEGSSIFSGVNEGCEFNLKLNDTQHPFVATSTSNAPTFTNATYIRTLSEGKYGTIVLPFVPSNVAEFKFYELTATDGTTLTFSKVENVEAGVPYIYKNADDGDISTEMSATNLSLTVAVNNPGEVSGWQLKGIFQSTTLEDTKYYVLQDDNKFYNTSKKINMIPFRAYLEYSGAGSAKMDIVIDDDEPAKISLSQIEGMENLSGEMYNLQGVRVNDNYKGIVISNGKKYLNK